MTVFDLIKSGFLSSAVYFIPLAVEFAVFIVFLILSLVLKNYGIKKRSVFAVFSSGISLWVFATVNDIKCTFLFLSVAVIFYSVLLFIPVKKTEYKKEQRQLVKFIDDAIKSGMENPTLNVDDTEKIMTLRPEPANEPEKAINSVPEVDYSHVKNVIKRIEPLDLNAVDKRAVRELEFSIAEAERGNDSKELKRKINDGLGSLLKVMSKYGI